MLENWAVPQKPDAFSESVLANRMIFCLMK